MVTEWIEWSAADAATRWDATLLILSEYNLYQSYGWGEFKRRHGWSVLRGHVVADGGSLAMAQCLVREFRATRTVMIWVPGGPLGSLAGSLRLGEMLAKRYRNWRVYLRTSIMSESRPDSIKLLKESGWVTAPVRIGWPRTIYVDLEPDEASRRRSLSANWRHNLHRGEQRGGRIHRLGLGESLESARAVYCESNRLKGIDEWLSLDDLQTILEIFGSSFTLAVSFGEDGEPWAMRGFVKIGVRAHDLVAGATAKGRKAYASYLLLWQLLNMARQQGVRLYDMGGIDPGGNAGVFNFKKGLGGRLVTFIGEWEWTSSAWLRWALNGALYCRGLQA